MIVPFKFTSITLFQDASGYVSNGPVSLQSEFGGLSMAALFINMLGYPSVLITLFSPFSIDFLLVISVLTVRSLLLLSFFKVDLGLLKFISNAATDAPAFNKVFIYSPPNCPAAPVTIATLPDR